MHPPCTALFAKIGGMEAFGILAAAACVAAAAVCGAAAAAFLLRRAARSRAEAEDRFRIIAQKVLEDRARAVEADGARTLREAVEPLGRRLAEYEKRLEEFKSANDLAGQRMADGIKRFGEFAAEARRYTGALVGGAKVQGVWGENILRRTLEACGLKEGEHFEMQRSSGAGIPDVWIYDALNSRAILVDAKTNIKDYLEACDPSIDKAKREQAMREHARSVRRQIDGLAAKRYAEGAKPPRDGYETLPLVGMFCPSEAALEGALSADPLLMQYAYDRGIVLATPLTLLGLLWLVSRGWRQKAVERRFDEIRDQGRKVVEAVDLLLGDVKAVANALASAQTAFSSLEKRLSADADGRTSMKRIAERLVAAGAAPSGKALKNL